MEFPHRWTHSIKARINRTSVLWEIKALDLQITQKKPMEKSKNAVWHHEWVLSFNLTLSVNLCTLISDSST